MRSSLKLLLLLFSIVTTIIFFTNCSTNSNSANLDKNQNNLNSTQDMTSMSLSESSYTFLDKTFKTTQYKLTPKDGSAALYVQWVSNCTYKCPTVVIANPYSGIDWTDDPIDQQWVQKPNAYSGIFVNDSLGPQNSSIDASLGNLFFQAQTPEQTASMGALFLTNNVSVLIINNRFYRGRNLKIYVDEFKKATQYFIENNYINADQMAFWGASLGGFITAYASIQTPYPPKALAVLTPLLDLKKQYLYTDAVLGYSNKSDVQFAYQDFFAPYKRRILDFTKDTPSVNPHAYEPYTLNYLAQNLKSDFLTIHDTWDTLVPVDQSLDLTNALIAKNKNVTLIVHQHATSINWDTFKRDHAQTDLNEGYTNENSYLFYTSFILNRVLPMTQNKVLLYDFNKVSKMLVEIKASENRGQNIKWIKGSFSELCSTNNSLVDYTHTIGTITGRYFVQQAMKNIWGLDKPEDIICSEMLKYFN